MTEPRRRSEWGLYALLVAVLPLATLGTAQLRLAGPRTSPELWAAGGLLMLNIGIAWAAMARKGPETLGGPVGFGLVLITIKLFVNTFTIFLFIGLQAVRAPVFVGLFFAGYAVLLVTTVWALHRTG